MADHVEQILHDMVEELDDLRRKQIFNEAEIKHIVKRRRDFEYGLKKRKSAPQDYLNYVRYEVALECLRRRRKKALKWKTKSISDFTAVKRLIFIFDRGSLKFKADVRFWYQYIDFCLRSGSTKKLSSVLYRAIRFHPRKVHLWLFAADRELKLGHIKAARTLLLRGLRSLPNSAKLWGEFFRLEFRVGCHLSRTKAMEEDGGVPKDDGAGAQGGAGEKEAGGLADPATAAEAGDSPKDGQAAKCWAPTCVLFRRALKRLGTRPKAVVELLTTAMGCLQEARAHRLAGESLDALVEEVHTAVAGNRPGVATGPNWDDTPADVAVALWELWWGQQRASESGWGAIAAAVAATAPPAVVQLFAQTLMKAALACDSGDMEPLGALLELARVPRTATSSAEAALVVLEALARCTDSGEPGAVAAASQAFLRRAVDAHPSCAYLRVLAWRQLPPGERPACARDPAAIVQGVSGVGPDEAARLLVLVSESGPDGVLSDRASAKVAEAGEPASKQAFEVLLRGLPPGTTSPGSLVDTFLAGALARGGLVAFYAACDQVAAAATRAWDAPRLRAGILTSLLSVQLRVLTPTDRSAPQLCARFEELLGVLDDDSAEKVDWWLRYIAFVHRMARWGCGSGVPTSTDLHWRAMRSVSDQTAFRERAHELLQSSSL